MNCTICNDTGKRAGSDYLDCSCGAAEDRAELQAYVDSVGWRAFTTSATISDLMWSIHQRSREIERDAHAEAVQQYKAQIDDLDQQNSALTNECRGMQAEKEAQAARIAELRAELMIQRDTTETYGYSSETARVAIEGCINTLDEIFRLEGK